MDFEFPKKLPKEWIEAIERNSRVGSEIHGLKVVGRDKRGIIVHVGGDSFKILHDGKNSNNFGYETAGSSHVWKENVIIGSVFDCPASGTAQSITAYIHTGGFTGTEKVKFGIYRHSDLSFVGSTEEFAVGATTFTGWKTLNFITSPSLSATSYILVVWGQANSSLWVYYNAGDTNQGHYQSLTYGTWPDPLVPTHDNNKYSIYCTYTVAPPAGGVLVQVM